jgi:hypothetical protein
MSYTGYSFKNFQNAIGGALEAPNMPERLGKSANGLIRMADAYMKAGGEDGWAATVTDATGNPLFTPEEQYKIEAALKPYTTATIAGGVYIPDPSALSGLSQDVLKEKLAQTTNSPNVPDIDDIYNKVVNKIKTFDSDVNRYASTYGILKLEKAGDLAGDVRMVSEPMSQLISSGILTATTAAGTPIPIDATQAVLSKIKAPVRLIVFAVYLFLDIARITMGVLGVSSGRKILSVLVALLELLRGDWKKAILTIAGYFGTEPLLMGSLLKVFLSMFRMLAPQLQDSIIYGSFDATKSMLVGFLLAIFQLTAPEEVRLPLIGTLESVARKKAEMDGTLGQVGLSARPDYLSPTWDDLNNIQAVISDKAYVCSAEFEELVKNINNAPAINLALQILRIPVNEQMAKLKCGEAPRKDFVSTLAETAKEEESINPVPSPSSQEQTPLPQEKTPSPQEPPQTGGRKRHIRILHSKRRCRT